MCKTKRKQWLTSVESYLDKHPKISLSIVILIVTTFAVYLGIKTELAISFAFLSIVVATFFASQVLKITRSTMRPFVTVTKADIEMISKNRATALPSITSP